MTIRVRYELDDAHVETLRRAYRETWFGSEWDAETVDGLLDGTDEMVALCAPDTDELLAFAHVVTDYTTVAFVRDVVVRDPYRGQGLGRRLVDELRGHPALADSVQLAVTCPDDLAAFYERCGFTVRDDGEILVAE